MILVVNVSHGICFVRLPSSYIRLQISFWEREVLSSQIEELSVPQVVHVYRSTRVICWGMLLLLLFLEAFFALARGHSRE